MTLLSDATDPNLLYDLKRKLEDTQIFSLEEIDDFCRVFFKSSQLQLPQDQGILYAKVQPAVDRFSGLDTQEEKNDFKHTLSTFLRLYLFLSQIIPFQDPELEKLYAYGRHLFNKLPKDNTSGGISLINEVALEYYRLQKVSEGTIKLEKQGEVELKPTTEAGLTKDKEEIAPLSEIIKVLNERFGTDFTEADKLFFDQLEEELVSDANLKDQAKNNPLENFKYGFDDIFLNKLIERMDQNQEIFTKIMNDEEFAKTVRKQLMKEVYKRINKLEPLKMK
jgi:type I restriction enzyme, R subunit